MNAIQKLFGIGFSTAALLGIMALTLFLTGCGEQYPQPTRPLVQIEPMCESWTICTAPAKTTYNISGSDCIEGLTPGQAQKLFDIFIAKNVKIGSFHCRNLVNDNRRIQVRQVN